MTRCPLCAAWSHAALRGTRLRCKLCALVFPGDGGNLPSLDSYRVGDREFRFPNWNNWLSRATRHKAGAVDGFSFAPRTVQMFAAREGRRVASLRSSLPLTSVAAPWLLGQTIHATVGGKAHAGPDNRLTLGIIAASGARQDVLALCAGMADCAAEAVVLLDTSDAGSAATLETELRGVLGAAGAMQPRVAAHPLDGDFAAQRNRVQAAARTPWVLQLDADEDLTPGTKRRLPEMIDDAEQDGWDIVGLARRNLVDGTLSALYPDIQYRLLRRSVRFTRAVHEHPRLEPRRARFAHLGAEIIHTVASSRLDAREALYKSIEAGADRPHDTALLRTPLEAGVRLPA